MSSFLEYIKRVKGVRKILLAGAGGVGKTSIIRALSEGKSLEELATEGIDLSYHRTLYLNLITIQANELVQSLEQGGKFVFYDVAGQLNQPLHAIRDTTRSTMGAVDLVMLVFDGSNMQSLMELSDWLEAIKDSYSDTTQIPDIVLIKNKQELPSNIDMGLVSSFVESELKIVKYFEVSSLVGMGLEELQKWLVQYFFGE
ncbi:MAG: GTPase domain-containing protein [Candidatus Kariarchaeaceae archaeon]|jgi:GTPase SAR1 family protein